MRRSPKESGDVMLTESQWKLLFKRRLNYMLDSRGMQQVDLANKMNADEGSISRYCTGKRTPSAYTILRMCIALNCSMEDLCGF